VPIAAHQLLLDLLGLRIIAPEREIQVVVVIQNGGFGPDFRVARLGGLVDGGVDPGADLDLSPQELVSDLRAEGLLRRAVDRDPDSFEALIELARLLRDVGRRERPIEMKFSLPDPWSRQLFIALCRRYDLRPYRYPRMHRQTVMVRAPESSAMAVRTTGLVVGALAIAVMASILPAIRAARLHPVEALRHE